jgi:hypothetical protein
MLCLSAGALVATLGVGQFTLAWTHSIERIRWEEDWRVESGALVAVEARIRGSGAGMDIPDGAVLKNGVWHYRPALPPQQTLRLARTPYAGDYTLCVEGKCRLLADLLTGVDNSTDAVVHPCPP